MLMCLGVSLVSCTEHDQSVAVTTSRVLPESGYRSLPRLSLERESPACPDTVPACALSSAAVAVAGPDGSVLLSDFGRRLVAVTKTPQVVRPIGSLGGGPGEYRVILASTIDSVGDMVVFDAAQRRVVRFDRSGTAILTANIDLPEGFIAAWFVGDDLHAIGTELSNGARGDSVPVVLYRMRPGLTPKAEHRLPILLPGYALGDLRPVPAPFEAAPQWAFGADGRILFSPGQRFELRMLSPTGAESLRFGFDIAPRKVTQEEIDRFLTENTRRIGDAQMRAAARARPPAPGRHPSITAVQWLPNRDVWVREAPSVQGDSVRWIVFSDSGVPKGGVTLDADARVLTSYNDLILVNDPGSSGSELYWARIVAR